MRSILMIVGGIAATATAVCVFGAIIGFLATQDACPGHDCSDAVGVAWGGVGGTLIAAAVAYIALRLAKGGSR